MTRLEEVAAPALAEAFASSPAGYIIGIGVPLLAVALGGVFVRYERAQTRVNARLDQLGAAMTANSQALALLVQQSTNDRQTLARIPDLDTAVAVLRDRVDRHEEHNAAEHERLRDATLAGFAGHGVAAAAALRRPDPFGVPPIGRPQPR